MVFEFDFSDELKEKLTLINKKDKQLLLELNKKIKQIISRNHTTIDFYKNCRGDLKKYKRIHIKKSFVLLFIVEKEDNFIWFDKLNHHDNIYKK